MFDFAVNPQTIEQYLSEIEIDFGKFAFWPESVTIFLFCKGYRYSVTFYFLKF